MLDESDKQWIVERLASLEAQMTDRLERVETTLLRFIRTNELRVRAGEAVTVSLQQRLDDLTDRVTKLESLKDGS